MPEVTRKRHALDFANAEPTAWDNIQKLRRKNSPYAHLRDVWVKDEDDAAEWVRKMASTSEVFTAFFKDQKMRNAMGVLDQDEYDKLTRAVPATGLMKEIGVMPQAMLALLWAQDPDILKDRERLYRFLNRNPEYRKGTKELVPGEI